MLGENADLTEVVQRIRENLKQSTKNIVTVDLTVEFTNGDKINVSDNPQDLADVTTKDIETEIWDRYERLHKLGRERGMTMAGDEKND